jgi:uncharacterized protein
MTTSNAALGDNDAEREVITTLLGRPPSGPYRVVVRRKDGTPSVIENAPFLDDGTPMPTRYWLVDPVLHEEVSRLESNGGVRAAEAACDPEKIAALHRQHETQRSSLIATAHLGPRPSGGVGGTRRGVKCLHAHLANFLAGNEDPVGEWVCTQIEVGEIVTDESGVRWVC